MPVVAPVGTGAVMLVLDQLVGVAVAPLKLTVLVPCVAPKLAPVITTEVPAAPEVGERLVIAGPPAAGAARNAAILATQPLEGERVHVAATDPARGWMRSSSA